MEGGTRAGRAEVVGRGRWSAERAALRARLAGLNRGELEIPLVIGGERERTGRLAEVRCPHDHGRVLARYHLAGPEELTRAVAAAREAWGEWQRMDWTARAAVLLRAAELLAGPYRALLNAATMLGQGKTVHQAEIDAACESIDFWRFNPYYLGRLLEEQPISAPGSWNRVELRPLEGFVLAISPFNFTSIAANLPTAPALMGNTVVWKPARRAVLSAHFLMMILEKAGLPPGVINMVPASGALVGERLLPHPELAGVHFTGSTAVFRSIWETVGRNIAGYRGYPRLVGETGGKDFVVVHGSADPDVVVTALIRGAFEYQGQKCSAASRAYLPRSLWPELRERLAEEARALPVGDIEDFRNFMGAVIDGAAFEKIGSYQDYAKAQPGVDVLAGGGRDDSVGWFIEPTVLVTEDPLDRLMQEEIFGPVLTIHVYDDSRFAEVLSLCDRTSPYGLTGSILARDRRAIELAVRELRFAAGNFYINDKPTGAVVGQQPFGGARASGTNDKAGSMWNLMRWVSPRTVKENLAPPRDYRYPFMAPDPGEAG